MPALILVNTFVSLFAGFMPVPGGMGVAEAGYTAGLVALGIPNAAAVSTALAFRLVTFYLPPIWGSFGMRWLRKHLDYLSPRPDRIAADQRTGPTWVTRPSCLLRRQGLSLSRPIPRPTGGVRPASEGTSGRSAPRKNR